METEHRPKKQRRVSYSEKAQDKTDLVKMTRDGKSADVHPNEVEHMKQHGWV
jgi:hypothetical protein